MDRPSFLLFVRALLLVRVPKPRLAGSARVGGQVRQETSCGPCLDCAEWSCAVLPDRRTTPTDRAEIGRISRHLVDMVFRNRCRRKAQFAFRADSLFVLNAFGGTGWNPQIACRLLHQSVQSTCGHRFQPNSGIVPRKPSQLFSITPALYGLRLFDPTAFQASLNFKTLLSPAPTCCGCRCR
jgi:hypothetical protein